VSHYQGVIMKLIPLMVIMGLGLVGCSGSKSAPKVSEETPQIELSDADEFIENPNEPAGEALDSPVDPSAETPVESFASTEDPSDTSDNSMAVSDEPVPVVTETESEPVQMSGSTKTYRVAKNETLMMIAFKLYGDYGKWKQIASMNRNSLGGGTVVREGQVLKYNAPAEEFVWNPQGLPYLIKTGDTLGIISSSVYQTPKKWKLIWDNNRPLIKNPNLIFAGFTIYYLENGREVAAEF
jgi:nucleoid-associated protein YgaU